jgi:hypothetical protein
LTTPELKAEFEKLQDELSTRISTTKFAHAGVSLVAALILASASAKLFWDSAKLPYLGILAAALSLGLGIYALVSYRRGLTIARHESERFEQLRGLQRQLGLDDPASLLPSR